MLQLHLNVQKFNCLLRCGLYERFDGKLRCTVWHFYCLSAQVRTQKSWRMRNINHDDYLVCFIGRHKSKHIIVICRIIWPGVYHGSCNIISECLRIWCLVGYQYSRDINVDSSPSTSLIVERLKYYSGRGVYANKTARKAMGKGHITSAECFGVSISFIW